MSARLLKDPATVSSRVFVGHLQTEDMTKHELEEHFAKYGTVVGSLINRGFGFVQFEEEQSAQNAIQKENGAMFKGRRIDVRPAKKDNQGNNNNNNSNNSSIASTAASGDNSVKQSASNNQFSPGNNQFPGGNDSFERNQSFGEGNHNFGGNNQSFSNDGPFGNQKNREGSGEQFGSNNQNRSNELFGGHPNRGGGQFSGGQQNQNRGGGGGGGGGNGPFGGNQNRPPTNQNRNQNNKGGNQSQGGNQGGGGGGNGGGGPGGPGGGGGGRPRGTRGGKNRNKNRENAGGNNFRDRSPINRGNRPDEKPREWELNKPGDVRRQGNFPRDTTNNGSNRCFDDYKGSGGLGRDVNSGFGSTTGVAAGGISSEYPPIAAEKNDCEIIVVNKSITEYAEIIEMRLKKMGLSVDLLFPNEDVPLNRVLGNIASRGCLYAIVVTHINQEHRSLTLNILHGLPQEHRNMPIDDAINLISRDFSNYRSGGRSVPLNVPLTVDRHPDAIQVLLNMLADNHQLTVLQYDRVIKYLEVKREEQVQVELGDTKDLPTTTSLTASDPKQAELQSRILNILNSNKTGSMAPVPSPVPAPVPLPSSTAWAPVSHSGSAPSSSASNSSNTISTSTAGPPGATTNTSTGVSPSPLLNDPTVQKALDSLLQGNLLKSIGAQQPPHASTPLFAAFPNIGRF
ncbi:uncharacterized protein LOC107274966 isoform X2 [Cephus cinctus]|uniref:Uncharacterized protein LOC107274966 isoform X2 n=1 Tax=Cephus cinctus TaxID=211228 RepID=A0AAJ7FVA9_CEPCN|nr:uncharacterized protein LOC107274966 isoform X2 [Cephus cinctus]